MMNLVKQSLGVIEHKSPMFKFENLFLSDPNNTNLFVIINTPPKLFLEKIEDKIPNDNVEDLPDNFVGIYNGVHTLPPKTSQKVFVKKEKETNKNISISEESEKWLMKKLEELEMKKYYLKQEFSLQVTAKKIKTNTTYLSYVVNKNYNKTFSAYYNELRINYVINEIINNKIFREYSTQAIAESAGFKNADSFASSFKKKIGVTPFQFINEIKKVGNG